MMNVSECTCVLSPRYNRVLVPFVCLPLVSCVVLFLHAWFVVIVFLRVLVSLFLISSPKCLRRWWETRPRPRWARSHPPPPVLHWLRDILISGILHTTSHFIIVCQVWNLYLTHLLLIDSLNPPLELQRRIWTHSALWTRRGLSKDTHLFQTYRKSVLGQKNTMPIPESVCPMRDGTF